MRTHELRLIGGTFQVSDIEDPANAHQISGYSASDLQEGFTLQTRQSGATAEKSANNNTNINLAEFSITALEEHWDEPQIQLQELMQIFVDYDNYNDFKKKDWTKFFGLVAGKLDQVNEKLGRAEQERDLFMQEAQMAEAKLHDFTFDAESEEQKRRLLEKDVVQLQQQVSSLLDNNIQLTSMTERNENLEKLQKDTADQLQ